MKRPEGFDRAGPQEPARPARVPRPPREPRRTGRTARIEQPAKIEQPARPRSARAEFAAAERRRRREERAEVRRFTRAARHRRIGVLAGTLVVAMLAGLVAAAVFSPLLALRHIVVDGTERLQADALVDALDDQLGTPLALLDDGRIRSQLGEFTLIRSYVTELVPPDTMLVHIVERSPIGVIAGPDGFRLIDPAGVTIDTTPTRPEGAPLIELADGDDVDGTAFRSMAAVLLALPPAVLLQVTTIEARTRDDVTLTLEGSSQRVRWGSAEGSDQKALTLSRLIELHKGDGPGVYDLSAPGIGIFHKD